ncbi:MAG: hypothetical protein A2Y62_05070 [Candidatus Fischerbacteria bacterium RBG_13_37_8]|uniref:NADH-quinone oxidoreductase subunit N n=1 Tax=Candidatus Fischerbacteria bacterium RBG_13_37_8 TaxID=1817863 RepID=A0A1F5V8H9_9BACT|nr:MAG: hypothetical protein A2Y62_05070 [Candidatus Fischerbacteria bacterium RBG_13_37_8]
MNMLDFTQLNASILPEIILVLAAIVILLIEGFQKKLNKYCSLIALIAVVGLIYYLISIWNSNLKGFYAGVVLDNFALFASLIYLLSAALIILSAVHFLDIKKIESGEFYALLLIAVAAMIFISSANDMITIFISLEIFSICLYVLVGYDRNSVRGVEGAIKYFILGAFSAGILLYGIVLIYGAVGSTNLEALSKIQGLEMSQKILLYFGAGLVLVGLGFKISLVPFHMWTPDAYEGAPTVITAFMAAATKTAAFSVLIRIFVINLPSHEISLEWILWILAIVTMTVGNFIALSQENIKRMLAYSSIAHAGYITVGLVGASGNREAGNVMYYLIVYAMMNIGAFLVIAHLERGKDFLSALHYKGLAYKNTFLALALSWFLLCLAGLPPTSGFLAKYYVFLAAVEKGYTILVIIAVLNSALAAYYYLRIIVFMWMHGKEEGKALVKGEETWSLISMTAIVIALLLTLQLSFMPSRFLQLALSF